MTTDTQETSTDESSTKAATAQFDGLMERINKIRERKAELKREYEAKVAPLDEAEEKIKNFFLKSFSQMGVDSVKTGHGTAYITTKVSVTVGDRDEFITHVKANDAWELLDVKANKTAVKEFREANDDLPPGLNWSEIRDINIRRS